MLDYSGEASPPSPDTLRRLADLAAQAKARELAVANLEAKLKEEKQALSALVERDIPTIMDEIGMSDFRIKDGTRILVKDVVRASISADRQEAAKEWFDANGLAGIVKRRFIISFNRDQTALVNKFAADLRKRKVPLAVSIENKVEPMTLKALVTRRLEAGEEVPMELLGVFVQRVAKIE